jgi:hypothetical protein
MAKHALLDRHLHVHLAADTDRAAATAPTAPTRLLPIYYHYSASAVALSHGRTRREPCAAGRLILDAPF